MSEEYQDCVTNGLVGRCCPNKVRIGTGRAYCDECSEKLVEKYCPSPMNHSLKTYKFTTPDGKLIYIRADHVDTAGQLDFSIDGEIVLVVAEGKWEMIWEEGDNEPTY